MYGRAAVTSPKAPRTPTLTQKAMMAITDQINKQLSITNLHRFGIKVKLLRAIPTQKYSLKWCQRTLTRIWFHQPSLLPSDKPKLPVFSLGK